MRIIANFQIYRVLASDPKSEAEQEKVEDARLSSGHVLQARGSGTVCFWCAAFLQRKVALLLTFAKATRFYYRHELVPVLAHNDAMVQNDKLESGMRNSREIFTRHEGNM